MAKYVELRRHTDNNGDLLTDEGIHTAMTVGSNLSHDLDLAVSSGAQRATQTIACFLSAGRVSVRHGVVVDDRFRSRDENRWKEAYRRAGGGDIEAFRNADPNLVQSETKLFAGALEELFGRLPEGGRALVVGHSPMQEAAVWGLTGRIVTPLGKGEGLVVVKEDDGTYRVEPTADSR